MKASMHAGRTNAKGKAYDVKHIDRKFESEYDKHIDKSKTCQNMYYVFSMTKDKAYLMAPEEYNLKDYEILFYKKNFSRHLDMQNAKHKKAGNLNRIRQIEDIYTSPRTCPQETILQVGKDGEYKDYDKFKKMVQTFCYNYNNKFKDNSMIVDCSIHADETSLHAHVRRVFYVKDEQGNLELAQNKALKKMGYELPHPEAKRSKYNNRLQTFTDDMRSFWQDIIESIDKGVKIDREANTSSQRHLEKLDYQNESATRKYQQLNQDIMNIRAEYETKKAYVKKADEICDVSVMYPDEVKVTEKGLVKRQKYVTVPAEMWEAKHVSANEKYYLGKAEEVLEQNIRDIKEKISYVDLTKNIRELSYEKEMLERKNKILSQKNKKEEKENEKIMDKINKVLGKLPPEMSKQFVAEWNKMKEDRSQGLGMSR